MKNFSTAILWIIGFIGLGGFVVFYNSMSRPWVNFSIESVSHGGKTYQEIHFSNTSENINNSAEVKIPFSVDKNNPNQIEAKLGTSGKDYKNENGEISMSLGPSQSVSLSCQDCKIGKSSIRNMSPDNFSLNDCSSKSSSCIYESKLYYYLEKLLSTLMYLLWIVGALIFIITRIYPAKT